MGRLSNKTVACLHVGKPITRPHVGKPITRLRGLLLLQRAAYGQCLAFPK
jgi:hypothetical protein